MFSIVPVNDVIRTLSVDMLLPLSAKYLCVWVVETNMLFSFMTKIPDHPFVQELNEKIKHSPDSTDSWDEEASARESFGSKPSKNLPPVPSDRHDTEVSSSVPTITGLDTPRDKKGSSDNGQEAFGEPNDSGGLSPFFFGTKTSPADADSGFGDRDAPLSHDPYAHYSRDSRRLGSADKNVPPLRHDEDDYFFGVPSESDAPVKPTTWEEIRRRAAEQRK